MRRWSKSRQMEEWTCEGELGLPHFQQCLLKLASSLLERVRGWGYGLDFRWFGMKGSITEAQLRS
jgi:hypothetical protein